MHESKLRVTQKENVCEIICNLLVIFDKLCKEYEERGTVTTAWEEIANSLEFIRDGTSYYNIFLKLNFVLDGNSHYSFKA